MRRRKYHPLKKVMSKTQEILTSLKAWRRYGQECLEDSGIEDAAQDAWLLMEYVCNINKSFYYLHMNDDMDEEDALQYQELIHKRAGHIPVQHLIGEAWFYGQPYLVNEHVLIPRQDTEVLIEEALSHLMPGMRILDLCTGSGCILLTLIRHASITGVGSDISPEALEIAKQNEKRQRLKGCTWVESNLFEQIGGTFDMITSNPPYIPTKVIFGLMEEVRDHEPVLALDGHEDGLYFYRKIVDEARQHLKPHGWLCMEIGHDQGEALIDLLTQSGYSNVEIKKDLAGLSRVAVAKWVP